MFLKARAGSVVVALVVVALAGCQEPDRAAGRATATAGAGASAAPTTGDKANVATAGRAPGAIKVDKTAGQDGALVNDSADDGVVAVTVDGPLTALAIVTVDANGPPDNLNHWDTIVESQPMPAGWRCSRSKGEETWQLGVEERGRMLNAPNGALTPVGPGPHQLTLYLGDASIAAGAKLMVLGERPDHSTVRSNVFTM